MMVAYTSFEVVGIHNWKEAKGLRDYLSYPHRHKFYFEVGVKINKDHEVEFIELGERCKDFIENRSGLAPSIVNYDGETLSCEMLVESLKGYVKEMGYEVVYVKVSEDNENGVFYVNDSQFGM